MDNIATLNAISVERRREYRK